jgi:hypothetical protein
MAHWTDPLQDWVVVYMNLKESTFDIVDIED